MEDTRDSLLGAGSSRGTQEVSFDEMSTVPLDSGPVGELYSVKLVFSVLVSCLSSIQYGYHMSELNAPELVYSCQKAVPGPIGEYEQSFFGKLGASQCISLENRQIGMVTSIFPFGGLLGSVYAGQLADKYGRKKAFALNALLFILGSLIETFSSHYITICMGRLISGIAAGSGIVVTPLFINEVSPLELRGTLGAMNQVSINIGILLTQLLAIGWANDEQWRFILLSGAVILLVNLVGLYWIDESPKWLTINGHESLGFESLMSLRSQQLDRCKYEVDHWHQLRLHQLRDRSNTQVSVWKYLRDPNYKNSRKVATCIMMGQQFCGINSIIFYGVKVLTALFPNSSVMINCLISVSNAVITFGASFVIDRAGRKPMLLCSVSVMCIASLLMGVGMIYHYSIVSVMSTFLYVGAFAIGVGPIPFLLISEVTQHEIKGIAQSYGTSLNWIATFLIGFLFPILNQLIGGAVYFIFALICLLLASFTYYQIPETRGKNSYEQVWDIRED